MYRLAAPESLPELLREIIEVGKVAIVAEAGVLWLLDRPSGDLVRVIPAADEPERIRVGDGHAGRCAADLDISNIHECREDKLFGASPVHGDGFETRSLLNVPIIGQGGITTADDALQFLLAGASTVGIGTALFYDPLICTKINDGIGDYLTRHKTASVGDLVGALGEPG